MKKEALFIFSIFIIIFFLAGVLASLVENNIPIQIQTTDASGNIITGTFTFTINISNSNTCSPVLYSNSTTRTTDARGIVSYSLENVDLDFDEQYWFCYYRDGVLKETAKVGRMPYAFRAKNVTIGGVEVNQNFNLSDYNLTNVNTGFFGWLGDLTNRITSLFVIDVNATGNINTQGNVTALYFTGDGSQLTGISGIPAGAIMAFNSESCPDGWIPADGTSGTPDLRGLFIRGAGTSGVLTMANGTAFSATLGTYQNDSFQEHRHLGGTDHDVNVYSFYGTEANSGTRFRGEFTSVTTGRQHYTSASQTQSGYGAPRTGAETRPASYVLTYCMKTTEDTGTSNTIWGLSGNNVFVQNTSKNVGIGTTSPTHKLNVIGSVNITGTYYGDGSGITGVIASSTAWNRSGSNVFLAVTEDSVGIGTSSPQNPLNVIGVINATGTIYSNNAVVLTSYSETDPKWTGNWTNVAFLNKNNVFGAYNQTFDTNTLFINSNLDRVGIGTTSPSEKLEVAGNINASGGRVYDKTGFVMPVGSITAYGAATAPSGWLLCNGAAVSRTTYADLFAVISTTYGVGDGSTTFNLPNFASKFPRGNTPGATGGSDDAVAVSHSHTFTGDTLGTHSHTFTGSALATHTHTFTGSSTTTGAGSSHTHAFTGTAMGTHGHSDTFAFSGTALAGHSHTFTGSALPTHSHTTGFSIRGIYRTDASSWAAYDLSPGTSTSAVSAGTPAGSINSVSAGTPAGSITGDVTAASAGTPAGTNAAEAAHTHTLTPLGTNTAVTAGTPAGTINSVSAGTPSGTVSTTGSSGTGANIPAYVGVNYIIKY